MDEFQVPVKSQLTIYSKSGCINCTKTKELLKEKHILFTVIDCDEYLIDQKEEFLHFIETLAGRPYRVFPMVFDNRKFIGGYVDVVKYVDEFLDFDLVF